MNRIVLSNIRTRTVTSTRLASSTRFASSMPTRFIHNRARMPSYLLGAGLCLALSGLGISKWCSRYDRMSLVDICIASNCNIDKIKQRTGDRLTKKYKQGSELQAFMHWCSDNRQTHIMKFILEQNPHFYTNNFMCEDVIFCSAQHHHESIIKFMLDNGADAKIHCGRALMIGDTPLITYLIKKGADVNSYDGLPLKDAISKGFICSARIFLDNGARIAFDSDIVRSLVKNKKWGMLELLLEYKDRLDDDNYEYMIRGAVLNNNLRMVTLLINKFINVKHEGLLQCSIDNENFHIAEILIHNGANIQKEHEKILTMCVKTGNLAIVKLLVENGTKAHCPEAVSACVTKGDLTMLQYLIKNGADINTCRYWDSILSQSIRAGHHDVTKFLIKNGAKVDDSLGTLLNLKGEKKWTMLKIFIENGANIKSKINRLLTQAVAHDRLDMVKLLVGNGANIRYDYDKALD